MPNGIYPVPPFDSHPSHATDSRPGLWLRFRTRWNRRRLDDELARGTDPAASDQLTLRAAQLRSRAVRVRLASRLIEALGAARRPNLEPLTARGRRQRVAVEESRDDLHALIRRLQDVLAARRGTRRRDDRPAREGRGRSAPPTTRDRSCGTQCALPGSRWTQPLRATAPWPQRPDSPALAGPAARRLRQAAGPLRPAARRQGDDA